MPDSEDRKPTPPAKETAQEKLNRFLKESGILIGTDRPAIDFTNNGQIIISSPRVIAVYEKEVQKPVNTKVN